MTVQLSPQPSECCDDHLSGAQQLVRRPFFDMLHDVVRSRSGSGRKVRKVSVHCELYDG